MPRSSKLSVYQFVHDCCCRLPGDARLWPTVGNGHVSMVVRSENVSMNGLYNGYMTASHRCAIPYPLSANVTKINNHEATNRTYILNTKTGIVQFLPISVSFTGKLFHLCKVFAYSLAHFIGIN